MKKKILISILSLICVFSAIFALGYNTNKKTVKASEITFSSSNYYQGITSLSQRFSTIETTINVPTGASTRGCIIGNYPSGTSLSFNSDFFSLETKATGTLRYFFRKVENGTYGNSECTFDYDLRGKGDVAIKITHTRSTGDVTAIFTTSTETVTKTGTVSPILDTSPVPNSLPLCVGNDYRKTTCPFTGTIKKISMKDSNGTLLLSYNLQGKGGYESIKDESGNGHDLKLVTDENITLTQTSGITFSTAGSILQTNNVINENINGCEAWINIPTKIADDVRPGVIWGNYSTYSSSQNCLSFEITTNGNPRFYARYNSSDHVTNAIFTNVDVRTGSKLHLSIFFDRVYHKGYCYVNGVLKQIVTINETNQLDNQDCLDIKDKFGVGGDFRNNTSQTPEQSRFKGTIYSLAIFSYGRPTTSLDIGATATQLTADMVSINTSLQGLVALYDFNGKQGNNFVSDLSGNGNHLISHVTNATINNFKPLDEIVYTSDKSVTKPINTVEAWVNMPKSYDGRGGIIIGNYCDTQGKTDAFNFEITADGKPRIYARYNNGDDSQLDFSFPYDIRTGEDMHLSVTLDRTNQKANLYVNGRIPDGCKNVAFTYSSGTTVKYTAKFTPGDLPLCVGNDHRSNKANSVFKGTIYNVALFSDIRTNAEILSDLEKINTTDTNLILAYDLKNNSNSLNVTDYSGNKYDLEATSKYLVGSKNFVFSQTSLIEVLPLTVEATIKLPKNLTARAGCVFGNYNDTNNNYNLEINTNGNPRIWIEDSTGTLTQKSFDVNVATGEWVHVAMVVNGTTITCYVNGKVVGNLTYPNNTFKATGNYVVGGDRRSGNSIAFKGIIKNIAVYKDVRTATEINNSKTTFAPSASDANLLCAYDFTNVAGLYTIQDKSNNNVDLSVNEMWVTDPSIADPTNFDYSFAVVGDTQKLVRQYSNYLNNDTTDTSFPQSQTFPKIYDYIINNAKSKKIAHVFGLGDITETGYHWGASEARSDHEFQLATAQFARLDAAGIDYSLVRGNHDAWSKYNQYLGTGADNTRCNYTASVDEYYTHPNGTKDYTNSIHYFSAGVLDYMVVTLDYGASDEVLQWAKQRILANPYKNAIITTHAYMFKDGTTLDSGDDVPPTSDASSVYNKSNINDGDDLWNELISQCPNIVLAMSGHDPCDNVVLSQWEGLNGNIVSNMLIDPQGLDDAYKSEGSVGAIAMFYFSNNGKTVEVRFWSTQKNCFIKTTNQYTFTINTIPRANLKVTWKNADTTLEIDTGLDYNSKPSFDATTPKKTATEEYTYTFAGWSTSKTGTAIKEENLPLVTDNITYYAIFTATKNKYTITWKDYDNTTLKTEQVEYGKTPSYGSNPTRSATAEYSYTFDSWSPTIVSVTKDATYTATYTQTKNKYTITWKDYDNTTLKTEQVEYGKTPSYGANPTRLATAEYSYTFDSWSPSIVNVTKNATYTATYTQTKNSYPIKFVVNGTIVKEYILEYGTTITYDGPTPTKDSTIEYTYTFKGWSLTENGNILYSFGNVDGETTFYAVFTQTQIQSSSSSSSSNVSSSNISSSSESSSSNVSNSSISSSSSSSASASSGSENISSTNSNSSFSSTTTNNSQSTSKTEPQRTTFGCGANFSSPLGILSVLLIIGSTFLILKKKHN